MDVALKSRGGLNERYEKSSRELTKDSRLKKGQRKCSARYSPYSLRCTPARKRIEDCKVQPVDVQAGTKALGFSKKSDDLYTRKQEDDLYFVMEQVHSDQVEGWNTMLCEMMEYAHTCNCVFDFFKKTGEVDTDNKKYLPPDKRKDDIIKASYSCIDKIKNYLRHVKPGKSCWLCYSSIKPVDTPFWPRLAESKYGKRKINEKMRTIEMIMAVYINKDVPFQLHMGICRNPVFLMEKGILHPGISIKLHAFSALTVTQAIKPDNMFLITTPLESMAKIFRRELSEDDYQEGYNFDGSQITYHDYCSSGFELMIKNRSGYRVFGCSREECDKYYWFLRKTYFYGSTGFFIADLKALRAKLVAVGDLEKGSGV